jgi:hypothetical protein
VARKLQLSRNIMTVILFLAGLVATVGRDIFPQKEKQRRNGGLEYEKYIIKNN